jgi:cysteine desulfurase
MIYLDHAAGTPVSRKVFEAMQPYFLADFFNPSAAYLPAKKVAADYEAAKGEIAHAIGAKAADLVITAGATEANNLAFTALSSGGEILYLETEHDSVRNVAKFLGGKPIRVLKSGLIDLDDLRAKISEKTEMISVATVNNELGTIQPLSEIAQIIKLEKIRRMKNGEKRQLLLHSDASQALNLLDLNVARTGVDLLTLNAAKVYGPKGVGALYVSHDALLQPINRGGGQENGLRSGTENVPGVIGFAAAVTESKKHLNGNRKKYSEWKKAFLAELGTENVKIINKKRALDNFIVVSFPGIDAERLIYLLEEQEVYVATGAACAASKGQKSHTLRAIGLTDAEINGSLRITLGETNDLEQIKRAASIIKNAVLTEMERLKNA